jgi:hypothetical protein
MGLQGPPLPSNEQELARALVTCVREHRNVLGALEQVKNSTPPELHGGLHDIAAHLSERQTACLQSAANTPVRDSGRGR